jgi:RHS repeat-associated protein
MGSQIHSALYKVLLTGFFALLFQVNGALGQTYNYKTSEMSNVIKGRDVMVSGFPVTLTTWSYDWDYLINHPTTWGDDFKYKSIHSFLKFKIDNYHPFQQESYTYYLTYRFYGYYDVTDTTLYTNYNDTLVIVNNGYGDPKNAYQDIDLVKYSNFYKTKAVITGIYIDSSGIVNPISLADTMRINYIIENSILSQKYDKEVSSNSYYGRSGQTLQLTPVPHTDRNYLTVFFNFTSPDTTVIQLTPVNYELEWTFVDDYNVDPSTGTHSLLSPSTGMNYNFTNNCTRVWLNENKYNIPLTYPSGYLVYRMRMVRPDSLQFRYPIYSDWSYATPDADKITNLDPNAYYHIASPFTGDSLNWQYTISFAEGGKYKHVASFYDGLLKNRESVTRFNSNPDRLIVGKSIYDFEGRPSIKILPTPVPSSSFSFIHDVDINSATLIPYKAADFDTVVKQDCPSESRLSPLDSTALAYIYYSHRNGDTVGVQKFVPDAEGYPLVHTIFSPAFNDRIEKQGGAGARLQIADSNIITNSYATPGQKELDRYFGINIGYAGFYNKTVTTDPNMQRSIAVRDYKGRQIFSALSGRGAKPEDHATMATDAPDSIYLRDDLLRGLVQTGTDRHRIADRSFPIEAQGVVTFQYQYDYVPLHICDSLYLNIGARYNYYVTDQCGDTLVHEDSTICTSGITSSPVAFAGDVHSLTLPTGTYDVHKDLILQTDSIGWLVDSALNSPLSCFLTENYFIRQRVRQMSFPCPVPEDDCANKKRRMKEELHPRRKYGHIPLNDDISYGMGFVNDTNSVFTIMYFDTVGIDGNVLIPHYRYQDTCMGYSLPDSITLNGETYYDLRHMSLNDFIAVYNISINLADSSDPIAEALLPLHPEYCKLSRCFTDTFGARLLAIGNAATAQGLNLLYLDSIISQDPATAYLAAYGYASPYDSLVHFSGGHIRLDSFEFMNIYCGCGDSAMQHNCINSIYSYEISNRLLVNDYVKQQYFSYIANAYVSNRQHFIDRIINGAGDSCIHCATVRMTLTPEPIFNVLVSTDTGLTPPVLLDSAWIGSGHESWLATAFASIPATGTPAMDSFLLVMHDSAVALATAGDSTLCVGRVNSIMHSLANCGSGDTAILSHIRRILDSLCGAGVVPYGGFTPQQVRYAIVTGGATIDDFCNQYLASCDFSGPSLSSGLNCMSDSFYRSFNRFLNSTAALNALRTPGGVQTYTLDNYGSLLEQQLYNVIGSTHSEIQAGWNSIDSLYRLTVTKDHTFGTGDTVRFYFRGGSGSCGNVFAMGDSISIFDVACLNTLSNPPATGIIKEYSFVTDAVYYVHDVGGLHAFTCTMIGWNDTIKTMNLVSNVIADCVPCTQMRSLFREFNDSMTALGVLGMGHPLYDNMIRNFMNRKLGKVYTTDQYYDFIESCALADSMLLKAYYGYAALTFANDLDADIFLTRYNLVDEDYYYDPLRRMKDGTGAVSLTMDFNLLPPEKLWVYRHFIDTFAGAYLTKVTNAGTGGGSSQMGLFYLPTGFTAPTATDLFGTGGSVSVNSAGTQDVWFGDHYISNNVYSVDFTSGTTPPWEISRDVYETYRYIYNHPDSGMIFNNYYNSTINSDFFKAKKIDYLRYTYGYQTLPPYNVLDSVQALNLETRIPSYAGTGPTYRVPYNPNDVTNLYLAGLQHPYYFPLLQDILQQVADENTVHTGYTFFDTNVVDVYGDSSLLAIRCGDNTYWYLYFGSHDSLYNIFVRFPAWVPRYAYPQYTITGMTPAMGDSNTHFFTLDLQRPGDSVIVHARGQATFILGSNEKLRHVLLGNPITSATGFAPPDTVNNCERDRLNAAIGLGHDDYIHYIDSARDAVYALLMSQLTDSVSERFYRGYLLQQFGVTLYYYDRAGNLTRTISPAGVRPLDTTILDLVDTMRQNQDYYTTSDIYPIHHKATGYQYDTRNLPVFKSSPDGGWVSYVYDNAGRLIYSFNTKQANAEFLPIQQITYNIYDKQNRTTETGEVSVSTSDLTPLMEADDIDGAMNLFRHTDRRDVVVTIYDTEALDLSTVYAQERQTNLRHRVACVKFFDSLYAADSAYLNYTHATHYSYDIDGSVKTLVQDFPMLDSVAQRYKRIDYDYDMISGKVNMLSYNRGFADQYYQQYTYDDDNRITQVNTSADGYIWHRDVEYTYYQHGPLARTELGDLRVQGLDYAYTIQGWLKSMNGDSASMTYDMGRDGDQTINATDAVGYTLNYFTNDYKPIAPVASTTVEPQFKNLYNGNIARQTVAYGSYDNRGVMIWPRFTRQYLYDQMNRLRNTDYARIDAASGVVTQVKDYHNDYTYDQDGNLLTLDRYARKPGAWELMDSFNYYYFNAGNDNKLSSLTDQAPNLSYQDVKYQTDSTLMLYLYDETGNTTKDLVAGQDTIQWNLYNKVTRTRNVDGQHTLAFKYDAMGNRVAKIFTTDDGTTLSQANEYYVHDAQGNVLAVYAENRSLNAGAGEYYRDFSLSAHNIYGSARLGTKDWWPLQRGERYVYHTGLYDTIRLRDRKPWYSLEYQDVIKTGYLLPYGNTLTTPARAEHLTGQKQYEVTDHLGNVLATVGDGRATVGTPTLVDTFKIVRYRPTLASMTDYYPFGMPMPDRQYQDATGYGTTVTQTMLAPQMHTTHIEWNDGLATALGSGNITGTALLKLTTGSASDGLSYVLHPVNAYLAANLEVKVASITGTFTIAVKQGGATLTTATVTSPGSAYLNFTPHVSGDATLEIKGGPSGVIEIDYIELDTFAFVPYTAISSIANQNKYRYGYNGQMKDDEWAGTGNHLDFLYRGYDPRTGRFSSVDPLAASYPWNSAYAFAENRVIDGKDLEGLEYANATGEGEGPLNPYIVDNPNSIFTENYQSSPQAVLDAVTIRGSNRIISGLVTTNLPVKGCETEGSRNMQQLMDQMTDVAYGYIPILGEANVASKLVWGKGLYALDRDEEMSAEERIALSAIVASGTLRGMNNPSVRAAADLGNKVHYDQLNGGTGVGLPTELSQRYPKTKFEFAGRGQKGPDVKVKGGVHPSAYPGSTWAKGNNFADFKPDSPSGISSFLRQIRKGKVPKNTEILFYDSKAGTLK